MTDEYRAMNEMVRQQYTDLWGAYAVGDFSIGDAIKAPGIVGDVLWSFKKNGQMFYVVGSKTQWPVEVAANEVQS